MACKGLCLIDRGVRTPQRKQSRYYHAGGKYCRECETFIYKPYSDKQFCFCCRNRLRYSIRQKKRCGVIIA